MGKGSFTCDKIYCLIGPFWFGRMLSLKLFLCPYQTIDGFLEGRIRGFNNKLVVLMTSFTVSVEGHRHLFEGISKKWGKGRLFSVIKNFVGTDTHGIT